MKISRIETVNPKDFSANTEHFRDKIKKRIEGRPDRRIFMHVEKIREKHAGGVS